MGQIMVQHQRAGDREAGRAELDGTGDQSRLRERIHRCRCFRCDVDVQQFALPMHSVIIALGVAPHKPEMRLEPLLLGIAPKRAQGG